MNLLTRDNIDEFIAYYHAFHDSYISDLKYDYKNNNIELLIDVFWCGEPTLKSDNTYETNKIKLKMYCNNIYQYKYKENYTDYIDDAYLKFLKIDNKEYICFATDKNEPLISIVCENIEYEEINADNLREDEILHIHEEIMKVYNFASEVKKVMTLPSKLGYYNKHLIKLKGKYIEQDYYMPVISVQNVGDICFNFDDVSYEFYFKNEKIKKYLATLIDKYGEFLSIYTTSNCDIDLYNIGDSKETVLKRLADYSDDEDIGITIIEKLRTNKGIVDNFLKIIKIFNEEKDE